MQQQKNTALACQCMPSSVEHGHRAPTLFTPLQAFCQALFPQAGPSPGKPAQPAPSRRIHSAGPGFGGSKGSQPIAASRNRAAFCLMGPAPRVSEMEHGLLCLVLEQAVTVALGATGFYLLFTGWEGPWSEDIRCPRAGRSCVALTLAFFLFFLWELGLDDHQQASRDS